MFSYVIAQGISYPANGPFGPDQAYPELAGLVHCQRLDAANLVYGHFRALLIGAGLDRTHLGTPQWNPLGQMLGNARLVVIKPNLVIHKVGELQCSIGGLVVHASVVRPLVDYLLLAATRRGAPVQIIIADTPIQSADFEALCRANGLAALAEFYRSHNIDIPVIDMRLEQAVINDHFMIQRREPLPGDPRGARVVDLGQASFHYSFTQKGAEYGIQDYDSSVTSGNHSGSTHRYKFSQSVLDADLVIDLCKLKTHAKAGVTLSLKNTIGANLSKDYLPHFRSGAPEHGGDEFPRSTAFKRTARRARDFFNQSKSPLLAPLHRLLKLGALAFARTGNGEGVFGGAWHGNDTLWRTIADINTILLYADRQGLLKDTPQRRVACVLDGIIGMQGEGPLKGSDKYAGLLALGDDQVEFDARLVHMMGLDPMRIKHIACWGNHTARPVGNLPDKFDDSVNLSFAEPSGWQGQLRR